MAQVTAELETPKGALDPVQLYRRQWHTVLHTRAQDTLPGKGFGETFQTPRYCNEVHKCIERVIALAELSVIGIGVEMMFDETGDLAWMDRRAASNG